ncbi:hypothetical protein PO124_31375 [Bacillus licheniformis]|nr:hypothetical protein [Bacillus licheniformis]
MRRLAPITVCAEQQIYEVMLMFKGAANTRSLLRRTDKTEPAG